MGLDWVGENMDVSILLVEDYWWRSIFIPRVKAGFPA